MKTNVKSGEEIEEDPFFHSGIHINLEGTNLEETYEELVEKINENFENFNKHGSGWMFVKIVKLEIHLVDWQPLGGSSWFPLPKELQDKKAIINLKNYDEKCFQWSVMRGVNPIKNHPERTGNLMNKVEEFNWSGISFPTKLNEIGNFERRNNISVNVYGWEGKVFPLRITKNEKERHVDLLLLKQDEKSHYCVIKNFSRLTSSQTSKHEHARFVCKRCLNSFNSLERLTIHKQSCKEFESIRVKMPKWGGSKIQKLPSKNACSSCWIR